MVPHPPIPISKWHLLTAVQGKWAGHGLEMVCLIRKGGDRLWFHPWLVQGLEWCSPRGAGGDGGDMEEKKMGAFNSLPTSQGLMGVSGREGGSHGQRRSR